MEGTVGAAPEMAGSNEFGRVTPAVDACAAVADSAQDRAAPRP